jgi:TolA-binding protein
LMTTLTPPPDDPDWASIRLRYEQDQETVEAIAEDVGLHTIGLAVLAKKLGWRLRGKPRVMPRKTSKQETTAATIRRVKDVLQQRLLELEDQIRDLKLEVSSIENERQMRSTNLLVRTIEKVMDLERKERARKRKDIETHRYFDDGQRQQLAEKIGRLRGRWRGQAPVGSSEAGGSDGVEQPVALLGEADAATAASRD